MAFSKKGKEYAKVSVFVLRDLGILYDSLAPMIEPRLGWNDGRLLVPYVLCGRGELDRVIEIDRGDFRSDATIKKRTNILTMVGLNVSTEYECLIRMTFGQLDQMYAGVAALEVSASDGWMASFPYPLGEYAITRPRGKGGVDRYVVRAKYSDLERAMYDNAHTMNRWAVQNRVGQSELICVQTISQQSPRSDLLIAPVEDIIGTKGDAKALSKVAYQRIGIAH